MFSEVETFLVQSTACLQRLQQSSLGNPRAQIQEVLNLSSMEALLGESCKEAGVMFLSYVQKLADIQRVFAHHCRSAQELMRDDPFTQHLCSQIIQRSTEAHAGCISAERAHALEHDVLEMQHSVRKALDVLREFQAILARSPQLSPSDLNYAISSRKSSLEHLKNVKIAFQEVKDKSHRSVKTQVLRQANEQDLARLQAYLQGLSLGI